MRIRHVEKLTSELIISQNQYWGRHPLRGRGRAGREPRGPGVGGRRRLRHADTRFGNVAAQLKQFMDQAGRLWREGKLADKVATAFTASMTTHGEAVADPRPQQHALPLGHAHPPARLHGEQGVQRRGQPVWHLVHEREEGRGPDEKALAVARYQGKRLARYAAVVGAAPRGGRLPRQAAEARALPSGRTRLRPRLSATRSLSERV